MYSYAIWLVPIETHFDELSYSIDDLAIQYNSESFSPHVTICSGQTIENISFLTKKTEHYATKIKPLSSTVSGFGQSSLFNRFLYLSMRVELSIFKQGKLIFNPIVIPWGTLT